MNILLNINWALLRASTLIDAGDRSVDKAVQPCSVGVYIQRKETDVSRQVNTQQTQKCQIMVRTMM